MRHIILFESDKDISLLNEMLLICLVGKDGISGNLFDLCVKKKITTYSKLLAELGWENVLPIREPTHPLGKEIFLYANINKIPFGQVVYELFTDEFCNHVKAILAPEKQE